MKKLKKATVIVIPLIFSLFSCGSGTGPGGSGEPTVVIPSGETDIKIIYNEGGVFGGTQVYTIWIESNTDDRIIPVLITKRTLDNYGQMGSGLAYWRKNIQSKLLSADVDAVTSATPNVAATATLQQLATAIPAGATSRGRNGFSLIHRNIPANMRKFTVYFEIDHSWVHSSYFPDNNNSVPSILYKAVIDLDAFPQSGEVKLIYTGWTCYTDRTVNGVMRTAGVLQEGETNRVFIDTSATGESYKATDAIENCAIITIVP